MPKMKTHKGAARRFKITGIGMIMRTKGMKSHFRRRKSPPREARSRPHVPRWTRAWCPM